MVANLHWFSALPPTCVVGAAITIGGIYYANKAINNTRKALNGSSSPIRNEASDTPESKGDTEVGTDNSRKKPAGPAYPGNGPTVALPDYEWRGKPGSKPGDGNGNYVNLRRERAFDQI